MAGFFYPGEQPVTPESIAAKRALIAQLQPGNLSAAPVGHWTQALARVVGSAADSYQSAELNASEKKATDENKSMLLAALGGSIQPTPTPAPSTAPSVSRETPAAQAPTSNASLPVMAQGDPTLNLLRKFEGFRDKPYWDVNAHRVGYGSDTITNPDGSIQRVQPGMQVSRQQAELDLQRRVNTEFMPRAQAAVGENWQKLNPNAQAALTSIAYNYGNLPAPVAAAARTGDPAQIAAAVEGLSGHNGGVNASRRQQEAALIRGGAMPGGATTNSAPISVAQTPGQSGLSPQLLAALSSPWAAKNPVLAQIGSKIVESQIGRSPIEEQIKRLQLQEMIDNQGKPKVETLDINGEKVPVRWNPLTKQMERVTVAGMDTAPPTYKFPDGRTVPLPADPVARKKFLEEAGQSGAKAVAGAPDAVQTAQLSLRVIDQLIGSEDGKMKPHAGLPNLFGLYGKLPTRPGSETANAEALLAQIKDRSFLDGIAAMRGTGAITEAEGAKATGAIARLSTNQSPEAFKNALGELRGVLRTAAERNQTIANNGQPPAGQAPARSPAAQPVTIDGWKIERI